MPSKLDWGVKGASMQLWATADVSFGLSKCIVMINGKRAHNLTNVYLKGNRQCRFLASPCPVSSRFFSLFLASSRFFSPRPVYTDIECLHVKPVGPITTGASRLAGHLLIASADIIMLIKTNIIIIIIKPFANDFNTTVSDSSISHI